METNKSRGQMDELKRKTEELKGETGDKKRKTEELGKESASQEQSKVENVKRGLFDPISVPDEQFENSRTVVAIFEYLSEVPDEISLKIGDIITDIEEIDEGWWMGTCCGAKGIFPSNFVKLTENSS